MKPGSRVNFKICAVYRVRGKNIRYDGKNSECTDYNFVGTFVQREVCEIYTSQKDFPAVKERIINGARIKVIGHDPLIGLKDSVLDEHLRRKDKRASQSPGYYMYDRLHKFRAKKAASSELEAAKEILRRNGVNI